MGALLGALLGALTGFLSGLLSEKARGRLDAVRAELQRLDDLQDAIQGVGYDLAARRSVNPSALQRVDALRTRLGQNLRRLGYSSPSWTTLAAGLDAVQQGWAVIEAAALDEQAVSAQDIDAIKDATEVLRRRIDTASKSFLMYRVMGAR